MGDSKGNGPREATAGESGIVAWGWGRGEWIASVDCISGRRGSGGREDGAKRAPTCRLLVPGTLAREGMAPLASGG
jgi:hypothetical protein